MSYNTALNPTQDYRHLLAAALVSGEALPDPEAFLHDDDLEQSADVLLNTLVRRDFTDPQAIMRMQYDRFGSVDKIIFGKILSYIDTRRNNFEQPISPELEKVLTHSSGESYEPTEELFHQWHSIHNHYFAELRHGISQEIALAPKEYTPLEMKHIFETALRLVGLDKRGWKVGVYHRTNLVSISSRAKKILVASHTITHSRSRLIGLVLHEVAIHALWVENCQNRDTDKEEGVGTLVEQLSLSEFYPLRLYRYLAICLAIGADGSPRTATEVYVLLHEIRRLLFPTEDLKKSRHFVAKEIVRVYRNLPTDIPGLVYVRDKKYIEHNAMLWVTLKSETVSAKHYEEIIAPWRKLL